MGLIMLFQSFMTFFSS